MEKMTIRRILMILLACVFLFCAGVVVSVKYKYIVNNRLNRTLAGEYTTKVDNNSSSKEGSIKRENVIAPIKVDFEALKEINPEIIGWIYCEDTVINYPIAQASNNDFYIDHGFDRKSNACGCAFADAFNRRDFVDSNTIVYGHHLYDGSMFATLEEWQKQEYYDEHPIMWLLTPERDYRVELFSAYYVSVYDEAYTIFQGPSPELDEYLRYITGLSVIESDVEIGGEDKYVMLSTCAYVFSNARAIVHGKMVPVDSAGGVLVPKD